jgi:CRP/FNR family transcriptional regulator, cyclic AMP receptor protein
MNLNSSKTIITISETNACPLYQTEDCFSLAGHAIFPPQGKPVCLILSEDIRTILSGKTEPEQRKNISLTCSGCSGTATLLYHSGPSQEELSGQGRQIDNISKILSNFSMFQSIDQHQITKLVKFLRLAQFSKGDFIIQKGDPGKNLYIVLSGTIEVLGDNNARIAILKKGEVFGEMSLLSGDPVGANIKVVEPAKVLYFQSHDFRKVLHQFPTMQLYLARLLSKRLAKKNIEKLTGDTAGISGTLSETPPPEICQVININQKTGVLTLHLPGGDAAISFRDGNIIKAEYRQWTGKEAFFEILKDTEGRFSFHPGLSPEEMQMREIGHFMCLLMEGVSRVDELSHGA